MSAPRLEPLKPSSLDADQRALYEAVLASPRGQGPARRIILRDDETLTGPFDAFLRTPKLGLHLERAGMAFREDTVLPEAAREVATLVVGRAWGADFEWWVHCLIARRFGVTEEQIDAIGHGRTPDFDDAAVSAAHDVAVGLVHQRAVDDATLERARDALGERGLVEVVTLVGFYQLVSGVLTTFEPPPPSGDLQVVGPPTRGARR
jgi:4-carboxymuconolactone decarboxylase